MKLLIQFNAYLKNAIRTETYCIQSVSIYFHIGIKMKEG